MRVTSYFQFTRLFQPTGVGKHIKNMLSAIGADGSLELSAVACSDDYRNAAKLGVTREVGALKVHTIPAYRRMVEVCWSGLRWPPVELWSGDVDWVYCPAEYLVATRRAKVAVTVHCDNWFDPELPWHHDPDIATTRRRRQSKYEKLRDFPDIVFAVSELLKSRLIERFGVPREKVFVVGNGVEQEYFEMAERKPIPDQRLRGYPYVLVIGGLTRRKGGDSIAQLSSVLQEEIPEVRIALCGQSEEQYRKLIAGARNIVELGYVDIRSGLPDLLAGAAALLFPSRFETFGIPAAEAMAVGTPPIVSRFGALPEIVGDAGIVLGDDRVDTVLEAVRSLVYDDDFRLKLSKRGIRRSEQFRWSRCAKTVVKAMHG